MTDLPRPEHPRPSVVRDTWLNLNGWWTFEQDHGDSGLERGLLTRELKGRIQVPFCMESRLSGIGDTDRCLAVWYRREVEVPRAWTGRQVVLHLQAADHDTTVWVNGVEAGRHRGGMTPIDLPLHGIKPGERVSITVRCRDDWTSPQPRGKQSTAVLSAGCNYTRTTGIWQTVWLEGVAPAHLRRPRIWPDLANHRYRCVLPVSPQADGSIVEAELVRDGRVLARARCAVGGDLAPCLDLVVPEGEVRLWQPGSPHLDDIVLRLTSAGGSVLDEVRTYAGLRGCGMRGLALTLNGRPRFQRLVLDQGYYPDGILTAPDDAALVRDIELSLAVGFDGARLHQKVFEERFLYHADRLGYLVWGEFSDWGQEGIAPGVWGATFPAQWTEALERDLSHPSIIGWCPVNESGPGRGERIDAVEDATTAMYRLTKLADPSRPVIDASGWTHRVDGADVFDSHDYEQDVATFAAKHAKTAQGTVNSWAWNTPSGGMGNVPYRGQPYLVSEFGGALWDPAAATPGWGYGNAPKSEDEFQTRFAGLCRALLENPGIAGYCYTQLTDVEQEKNGLYRYDRSTKLDVARLHAAQRVPAAIDAG